MKKLKKGFSLIELMIVIAIIAILASVAIPMYSNYTIRAKVGGALTTAAAVKVEAAEVINNYGSVPPTADDAFTGITAPGGISIAETGVITLDLNNDALGGIGADSNAAVVTLTPTTTADTAGNITGITWTCTATGDNLSQSKVPSTCTYSA